MDVNNLLSLVKLCIPPLDNKAHKGQAGRIGIVGGSLEYTGAPYFAGISALKVGADLVHIFCSTAASTVIKSYSPELIVHPLLNESNSINEISPWLDRLHCIVIGPGLGRDPAIFSQVTELIKTIKVKKIPLVIDADGLFLITEKPELIKDFSSPVILTPNKMEFQRLNEKHPQQDLGQSVTVLHKGNADTLISPNSKFQWKSDIGGTGRRCGGQGDLLSGSIATFLHWTLSRADKLTENTLVDQQLLAASISCLVGSLLVRKCNEKAFKIKGRSMLASDMIEHIHEAFTDLFDDDL